MKKITVTISPLGLPTIEAHGFAGQGCGQATAGLEKALSEGKGGYSREYKPEWNASETDQEITQSW